MVVRMVHPSMLMVPAGALTDAPLETTIPDPNTKTPALANELEEPMVAAAVGSPLTTVSMREAATRVPVTFTVAPGTIRNRPVSVAPVRHCNALRSRICPLGSASTPEPAT